MEREQIKTLIELATDFDEADKILSKYTSYDSDAEKLPIFKVCLIVK